MAIYGRDKIDIFGVFVETISFFCRKFGSLAGISLVFLLTVLTSSYFLQDRVALTGGFPRVDIPVIVRILILAVSFLIIIWVKAALINATAAQYQGSHFAYSEMTKDVNGKYWRIFRAVVLLEVVLLIPAIYFPIIDNIIDTVSGSTMTLLGLVAIGLFIYLYIKFTFVVPCAVLEDKNIGCFRISSRLVKGNFWRICAGLLALGLIENAIPLILSYVISGRLAWVVTPPNTSVLIYNLSINLGNQMAPAAMLSLQNVVLMAFNAFVIIPLEVAFITLLYLRSKEMVLERLAMDLSEDEETLQD